MQLKPGTLLQGGKYKIERCLGQGSFGITYLAKMKSIISGGKGQTSMRVDVAIKEFFMKDFNSRQSDGSLNETAAGTIVEKYKKDFKREADNLSKMNHHGVVDILDTFEENNTCYLVMAYIDGESLEAYISKNGAMPEKEALTCFEQIADALHYMHCQHMLHLDLKPRNIMLDSESHTFIIDFGLSKQYDDNDEPESSTTLGQGTQGYAPIEQGAPHSGHDFPVTIDVYALGATLYKMLTAQTPPHAAVVLSSPEMVKNVLISNGISKTTIAIILKAMSPRKEDRYENVTGLMKAFGWTTNVYPQETVLAEVLEYPSEDNTIVTIKTDTTSNEKRANIGSRQGTLSKAEIGSKQNSFSTKTVWFTIAIICLYFFYYSGCNEWMTNKNNELDSIPDESVEAIPLDTCDFPDSVACCVPVEIGDEKRELESNRPTPSFISSDRY